MKELCFLLKILVEIYGFSSILLTLNFEFFSSIFSICFLYKKYPTFSIFWRTANFGISHVNILIFYSLRIGQTRSFFYRLMSLLESICWLKSPTGKSWPISVLQKAHKSVKKCSPEQAFTKRKKNIIFYQHILNENLIALGHKSKPDIELNLIFIIFSKKPLMVCTKMQKYWTQKML